MIRREEWIPRGDKGVMETLYKMRDLAMAPSEFFTGLARSRAVPLRDLDAWLRSHWRYVPDAIDGQPVEVLRTLDNLASTFLRTQMFEGDCDDAAIAAAAFLQRMPGSRGRFVAARPPEDPDFSNGHVFCVFALYQQWVRVDPTAPLDANYTNWELKTIPLFQKTEGF